jgi:DNA-binding transcriptional LysR family regulator
MKESLVELRVWRQFSVLAEELHFGRAALRLHMTQPPLTQAIAQLEASLGLRLFDRTQRSVRLTDAGRAILDEVRDLLERARELPARAQAAAQGRTGLLRLGFVSTVGFDLLPAWVQIFRNRFPQVQLELIEATGDAQLQAFERGELDAGFILHSPGFAPAGFERRLVAREPLVLALAQSHSLADAPNHAKAATPWLESVLAQPIVMFPRRILPSLHDAIFGLYHGRGRSPLVVQEAIQMQTIVNLVSAGLGLAWVPQSVTQFRREGVVYRSPHFKSAKEKAMFPVCETSLIWPSADHPVVRSFSDCAPLRA